MSYWQAIAAIGQAAASRRNSRQLQSMSNNRYFSGSTAGQKIDQYGRLATQLAELKENSKEQTAQKTNTDDGFLDESKYENQPIWNQPESSRGVKLDYEPRDRKTTYASFLSLFK